MWRSWRAWQESNLRPSA